MKEMVNELQRQSLKTTQLQEWVGGWVGGRSGNGTLQPIIWQVKTLNTLVPRLPDVCEKNISASFISHPAENNIYRQKNRKVIDFKYMYRPLPTGAAEFMTTGKR